MIFMFFLSVFDNFVGTTKKNQNVSKCHLHKDYLHKCLVPMNWVEKKQSV